MIGVGGLYDIIKTHTNKTNFKPGTPAQWVAAACACCFLIRLYMAIHWPVDLDAGYYLYDAKLAVQGKQPLLDYFSRSPVYHYLLGYWMEIFGYSLLSGRLFIIAAQTITVVFVYLIGRDLFSDSVGVLSAMVFSISPFVAYWGHIIKTEPLALLLGSVATWLVLRDATCQSSYRRIPVMIAGILIGLGHLVRASILLYPILFSVIYITFNNHNNGAIKKSVVSLLYLGAGFLTAKAAFAIIYDYPLWLIMVEYRNPLAYLGLTIITGGSGGSAGIPSVPEKYTKVRVILDTVMMAIYLFVPATISLLLEFKHREEHNRFNIIGFLLGVLLLCFTLLAGTTPRLGGFHTTNMSDKQLISLALLLVTSYWSVYIYFAGCDPAGTWDQYTNRSEGKIVILSLLAIGVTFYMVKSRLFVGYFAEFAVALSILTAVGVDRFIGTIADGLGDVSLVSLLMIICLLTSLFIPLYIYGSSEHVTSDRRISADTVNRVSDYIKSNSDPSAEVLTRQLVFALDSNRRNVMGLSRGFYTYPQEPTKSELVSYIERTNTEFIITSPRTDDIITNSKKLRQCIFSEYKQVKKYKDTTSGNVKYIRIFKSKGNVSC
jgi:4-amino-4-deoxy-L-arabinose transferase-like glycosyltransferase